jgi:hypothetical protein
MSGYEKNGHNVTYDNFFTNLKLAKELSEKGISSVGTIRTNRRELPDINAIMKNNEIFSSKFVWFDNDISLTMYKCKRSKCVALLSSTHREYSIGIGRKKKPNTIEFYNKNKCGVDNADQMLRLYTTRRGCRRWPVCVFYNILDMALLNSWIIYKAVNKSNISRSDFQLELSKELCNVTNIPVIPLETNNFDLSTKRTSCKMSLCNNKTSSICVSCYRNVCGIHSNGKIIMTKCFDC